MIEILEAVTKARQRDFIEFPNRLYKDNGNYSPALYLDEKKIFRKDYMYYETCDAVYYNAYRDGKMVGRISGIIQHSHNAKTGEKRARFTRFDVINDFEVAAALFEMVENWAREKGMELVCGPLGFSDFEREGMLVEGFDKPATFEEQYNAPWYPEFMDRLGYRKEVDWLEFKITAPENYDGEMDKMSDFIMKRYHLRWGESKSGSDFLDRYKDGFFDIVDRAYEKIYGTVPFTDKLKKLIIDNFRLIIDNRFAAVILDENDRVICLGLCFPAIGPALRKSGGHITPCSLPRLLKAIKRPEVIDFGLIGVDPAWENRGVSVCIAAALVHMLQDPSIKYAETNLNLEDNYSILNLWKRFGHEQTKRRRSYIKSLV